MLVRLLKERKSRKAKSSLVICGEGSFLDVQSLYTQSLCSLVVRSIPRYHAFKSSLVVPCRSQVDSSDQVIRSLAFEKDQRRGLGSTE
jgi:hypothetical protein